jgi:hypothetical protein
MAVTTQCTFSDESGEVRLDGTIGAPGATAANVLTADGTGGTSWSPAGGASALFMPPHAGSPDGVVVPTAIGYLIIDSTNGALWQAIGATNADWVQVGGYTSGDFGVATTANRPIWQVTDSSGPAGIKVKDSTALGTAGPITSTHNNVLDDGTALGSAKLLSGFGAWGHAAPATQPITPVLLADVIAVLQAYGLCA